MTQPESTIYSYSRLFRKVIPSDSLKAFIKNAQEQVFDGGAEFFAPDSDPLVYAVDSLRVTQFERRVRAGTYVAELGRMHTYVTAPEHVTTRRVKQQYGTFHNKKTSKKNDLWGTLKDVEDKYELGENGLFVRANDIVDSTKTDYEHQGTELALEIEAGEVADMLDEQTALITVAAMRTKAGQHLPKPAEPDNPRLIPFMHGRFVSDEAREKFVGLLRPELPVYDVGLRHISKTYQDNS